MQLAVLVALLAALQLYANTATTATEFKCYNTLITDEWREAVLERHNTLRQRLSNGGQKGSDGMLPKAGNINKLNWDCNMEMLIDEKIGECNEHAAAPANAAYGAAKEMLRIDTSKECDAISLAKSTLNKWWKDGAAKQKINKKVAAVDAFTEMAFATTDGFACSYRRCGGKFFLVCFYNKAPKKNDALYADPIANQACDNCEKYPPNTGTAVKCEAFLCQYPLTPAVVKLKVCDTCTGKFSDEFRLTALDMHNYYRRLVATGWAKNGDKYAKTAAKMVELKYEKTLEDEAIANADKCPNAAKTGPEGENFWGLQGGYNMPYIEAVKEAMKFWWEPFEKNGFGDTPTYTSEIQGGDLKYAANILHEGTTSIGCAVNSCPDSGRIVIDCRYNNAVQVDDAIYTPGKVCSKCRNVAGYTSCSKLGGLCVP